MPEVGRNDPCPCGSGKKYKKCCGQKSPMKRRTYSTESVEKTTASIQRITGMVSQTLRKNKPKAPASEEKQKNDEETSS